jgi:hypothetical protein
MSGPGSGGGGGGKGPGGDAGGQGKGHGGRRETVYSDRFLPSRSGSAGLRGFNLLDCAQPPASASHPSSEREVRRSSPLAPHSPSHSRPCLIVPTQPDAPRHALPRPPAIGSIQFFVLFVVDIHFPSSFSVTSSGHIRGLLNPASLRALGRCVSLRGGIIACKDVAGHGGSAAVLALKVRGLPASDANTRFLSRLFRAYPWEEGSSTFPTLPSPSPSCPRLFPAVRAGIYSASRATVPRAWAPLPSRPTPCPPWVATGRRAPRSPRPVAPRAKSPALRSRCLMLPRSRTTFTSTSWTGLRTTSSQWWGGKPLAVQRPSHANAMPRQCRADAMKRCVSVLERTLPPLPPPLPAYLSV